MFDVLFNVKSLASVDAMYIFVNGALPTFSNVTSTFCISPHSISGDSLEKNIYERKYNINSTCHTKVVLFLLENIPA